MTNVWLHDGRVISNKNFSIHDTEYRRLTAGDKWAMRWAWRVCAAAPANSVVLAMRSGVIGAEFGAENIGRACLRVVDTIVLTFERLDRRLPGKEVAAVVNAPLNEIDASILARVGTDVLFLPRGVQQGREGSFMSRWFGPKLRKDGKEIMERHVSVEPRWSRMDKILR